MFSLREQQTWLAPRAASPEIILANDPLIGAKKIPLQLRLIGATALLLFTVVAMFVVIAYLLRVWRRQVSEPMEPTRLEPDAWARKSLAPHDDSRDGSDA